MPWEATGWASAEGLTTANQTFWRSLAALAATFWLVLNLPFPQLLCYSSARGCRGC
jgi:hypothetical protein